MVLHVNPTFATYFFSVILTCSASAPRKLRALHSQFAGAKKKYKKKVMFTRSNTQTAVLRILWYFPH